MQLNERVYTQGDTETRTTPIMELQKNFEMIIPFKFMYK